jgi:hypothetical protein
MSKKDKLNLDLDFEELGAVNKVITNSSEKRVVKKQTPKSKYGDLVLSIPLAKPTQFLSKTIEKCNGHDFIKWANNVAYPLDHDHKHYDKESNRSTAFLRILSFHKRTFLLANPDSIKTLH